MERRIESRAGKEAEGKALLEWLAGRFSYLSEEAWAREIKAGRLVLNGSKAEPGARLAAGDRLAYLPAQAEEPEVDFRYRVVHEDEDFLLVDKPPLLPCHPGGRFFEHSLWYLLRAEHPYLHIATRLDRETSGLVLVCLKPEASRRIAALQGAGRLRKRYLALVHGSFPERLEAEGWLGQDPGSAVRKRRRFFEGVPSAIPQGEAPSAVPRGGADQARFERCATAFSRLFVAEGLVFPAKGRREGPFSLVEARPSTGRSHQIRASLSSLGYPLVGDKLYGLDEAFFLRFSEGRLSAADEERLILPYQALHCAGLEFEGRAFAAPLPSLWPELPAGLA